jgi:hypothetical protein
MPDMLFRRRAVLKTEGFVVDAGFTVLKSVERLLRPFRASDI